MATTTRSRSPRRSTAEAPRPPGTRGPRPATGDAAPSRTLAVRLKTADSRRLADLISWRNAYLASVGASPESEADLVRRMIAQAHAAGASAAAGLAPAPAIVAPPPAAAAAAVTTTARRRRAS
jgi:hypothetical protein